MGVPHQCSLGTAGCYLLVLLTCALLMTSSHSEGPAIISAFLFRSEHGLHKVGGRARGAVSSLGTSVTVVIAN